MCEVLVWEVVVEKELFYGENFSPLPLNSWAQYLSDISSLYVGSSNIPLLQTGQ